MALKKNIVANYLGQGWRSLMSLAFIPVYIKYLGIEAYGLIGIFAILQACLALVDMGMKPALGREMARFVGGASGVQTIRDLLRSVLIVGLFLALFVALGVWGASTWLATNWVGASNFSTRVISQALILMGVVSSLTFLESIYVSSIVGLQRQVLQNVLTCAIATLRAVGAVGILAWLSPTIEAFFVWQAITSLVSVCILAMAVHRSLPVGSRRARFSIPVLLSIWRFAAGMLAITFLSLLLTQIDKIILSRLLNLEAFGYYTLAGIVATALYALGAPVASAFLPRLTQLVTERNEHGLRAAYHQGAQLITVLMGASGTVLIVFGHRVLLVWTSNAALATEVAPLLAVMTLGTVLHGMMWIPSQLQLAYGWTSLSIKINAIAVSLFVPAIILIVPHFGAMGAAWTWVALNAVHIIFTVALMHRRLLATEKWRWYIEDVGVPLIAAFATAKLLSMAFSEVSNGLNEVFKLLAISAAIVLASAFAAPLIRRTFTNIFKIPLRH